jgi:hypothetical protein
MQGVVFEEWWEVWAMDGEWRASSGWIDVRGWLFLFIEKVTKLKAERGTSSLLQTSNLTPARQLSLEWSVEKGLVKRDGRWWSQRWSSNESVWGLRFSYIFNRSFELVFMHDYYGKPKRHDKLVTGSYTKSQKICPNMGHSTSGCR